MPHPRSSRPAHSDAIGRHQAQMQQLGLGSAFPVCNRCKKFRNAGTLVNGCVCPPAEAGIAGGAYHGK